MVDQSDRKKRSCVVPTCHGERFDLVHKFPMETDRTWQWLNALLIPDLYNVPFDKLRTSYYVCSRHFREKDYKNPVSRYLNKTAVPCINLKTLDQMELVLHRSHRRPSHLQDNVAEIETISRKSMKRLHTTHPDDVDSNNAGSGSSTDHNNYLNEPFTKLSNLIQLDGQHFTILCDQDDADNLSSSEIGDFTQLIIENVDSEKEEKKRGIEENIVNTIEKHAVESEDQKQHNQLETDKNRVNYELIENDLFELNDKPISMRQEKECFETVDKKFVTMTSKFLKVSLEKETLSLDYFWLRDHCRCALCFNHTTNQRKFSVLDIKIDIKPITTDFKNEKLFVKWEDEHESEYNIDFLFKSQFDYVKKSAIAKQILWDKKRIANEDFISVDLGLLVTEEEMIEKVLKSLITYGIAFIKNVPTNQDMTEMAVRRLFPIHKTFFGEMWTFGDLENENHADTAYSKEYLEAHTDNTYLCDAAGLLVLHCLEHVNGSGGETFLVDGFKVIQDLMKQNYDAYQKLVEINVPAEYIESGRHHTYSAPVIRLNLETKKPEQIRFNLYDRAILNTLPQSEMREFYEHFRYLAKLIQSKENQWTFKLKPGTMLIFDNWRILHGRESFTGVRRMCGCYISRAEFLSKARTLGLIR